MVGAEMFLRMNECLTTAEYKNKSAIGCLDVSGSEM